MLIKSLAVAAALIAAIPTMAAAEDRYALEVSVFRDGVQVIGGRTLIVPEKQAEMSLTDGDLRYELNADLNPEQGDGETGRLELSVNITHGDDQPEMPRMSLRMTPFSQRTWVGEWTVFYWAWWVSWAPFVGLFIARISRGRTIRQFVTGVLLVPSIVTLLWFAIFGGGAIGIQERAERANDMGGALTQMVDGAPNIDFNLVLFDYLGALSLPDWLKATMLVVTVIFMPLILMYTAWVYKVLWGKVTEADVTDNSHSVY
jgi:hypothetical protein